MKSKEQILEIAKNNDLKVVEITYGSNGYPSGLGDNAIIEFEDYNQALNFAETHGLETHLFKIRDGWHFWTDMGSKHKALTYQDKLDDLGDNYNLFEPDYNVMHDQLTEMSLTEIDDLIVIREKINSWMEQIEEFEALDEDEILIVGYGTHYDTCEKEMMQYSEDVWTYAVGVFVPKEENEW